MPFEVTLNNIPAGHIASVNDKGEANVFVREFVSSEDGDLFISRLEAFPSELISMLPASAEIRPDMIHQMLALIRRDKSATVYINEINLTSRIRFSGRRSVQPGDPIYKDDVLDIEKLSFENVEVPNDVGVMFVFSAGWRRGYFYDLTPLTKTNMMRDYDLETVLGHYFAYLSYQHLFKVTESEWEALFAQRWFPFASLKAATRKKILSHVKNQRHVDNLLGIISNEVKEAAQRMLGRWEKSPFIAPSFPLIQHAVNRYLEEDYISATHILYTEIEGVMRRVYYATNPPQRVKAPELATHVIQSRPDIWRDRSLLLPLRFDNYLKEVYLASFDPNQPAPMSRTSVAHGVASPEDYTLKAATIGLLILDQIFYFLPDDL